MTRCYRCGGVMIHGKFYGDWEHFLGWKCVSCGEIVVFLIASMRESQKNLIGRGLNHIFKKEGGNFRYVSL